MIITWDTTLKEFREKFEDEDFVKKIESLRENAQNTVKKYNFDLAIAILLGGTSSRDKAVGKYREISKENGTWESNCGRAFTSNTEDALRKIPSELNRVLEEMDENMTIKNIKDLLLSGALEKNASNIKGSESEGHLFKDINGIIEAIEQIVNM